jgi:hypothetical protein
LRLSSGDYPFRVNRAVLTPRYRSRGRAGIDQAVPPLAHTGRLYKLQDDFAREPLVAPVKTNLPFELACNHVLVRLRQSKLFFQIYD